MRAKRENLLQQVNTINKCRFAKAGFIASAVFLSCGAIARNLMWFNYDEQQESELR
jgi:hypothetical protein